MWSVYSPTRGWINVPQPTLLRAVRAGTVPPTTLVRSPQGATMSASDAFPPAAEGPSPWEAFLKGALVAAAAVGAALVVKEGVTYVTSTREQRSIRASARRHEASGALVEADHIGWGARPPIMGGRRPDVVAYYASRVVVEEHETIESVGRSHSVQQDRDLRKWARRKPRVKYKQIVT